MLMSIFYMTVDILIFLRDQSTDAILNSYTYYKRLMNRRLHTIPDQTTDNLCLILMYYSTHKTSARMKFLKFTV